jgi:subtilase family serine protease
VLKKSVLWLIPGSVIAAALVCAAPSGAAQTVTNSQSVAGWVSKATPAGAASSNTKVTIAIHMAVKDSAGLKQLVADVSTPSSKNYGHYLTPEAFASRFAPAAADVQAAKALLEKAGMTEVTVGPHGVYVSATATVGQLKSTFHISQNMYTYKGMTLRANTEEPTLPASLAGKVVYVEGLDDTTLFRKPRHESATMGKLVAPAGTKSSVLADGVSDDATASSTTAVTPPPVASNAPSPYCNTAFGSGELAATLSTAADVYGAQIPWLNCGYTPQQIQVAYGLNKVKYDGKGVTVAIIDAYASPTILADANRYAANHDLPKLVQGKNFSQIVPVGIFDVSPDEACGPYGWWGEQSLDFAALHGAAPGATILYIGARDCGTTLDIALINAVYNHLADVITNSYGYNGESIAPGQASMDDQAYMAGAAQGITVLFSSGDDGDLAEMNGVATGAWPATSSYVTGVGGTSLLLKNSKTGEKSEYGWGNYRDYLADATVNSAKSITTSGLVQITAFGYTFDDFAYYAGAGGGISLISAQPSYQAGVVPEALATTYNLASGFTVPLEAPQRVSPDVAMVADPYTGYLIGETFTIAGDPTNDAGCIKLTKTTEYCEIGFGGTSLASPLMAGVVAIMDQKRAAASEPTVGFANPLLYSYGTGGNGVNLSSAGINQIVAPKQPVSLLRGYTTDLTRVRVVTINSVPFFIDTTDPYALLVCDEPVCLGINEIFNFTSLSPPSFPGGSGTPAGYNDVTGLGVPYVPKLVNEE